MGEYFFVANPQQRAYLDPFRMFSSEKCPTILQDRSMPERIALLACQFEGSEKLPDHLVWTQELLSTWSSQKIVLWGDYKFESRTWLMQKHFHNLTWPTSAMVWEHDLSNVYQTLTYPYSGRENLDGVLALGRSPHLDTFRATTDPSKRPPRPERVAVVQAVTRQLGYPAFYLVNLHTRQKIKIYEYSEHETVFAQELAEFATKLLAHMVVTLPQVYRNKNKAWFDCLRSSWSQHSLWVRPQPPIEVGDDDYEDITPTMPAELLALADLFDIALQDPVTMRFIGKVLYQPHNEGFRNTASHILGCDWRAAYHRALEALNR